MQQLSSRTMIYHIGQQDELEWLREQLVLLQTEPVNLSQGYKVQLVNSVY